MPLYPYEFVNPEDVIDRELFDAIRVVADRDHPRYIQMLISAGSHVFWLGPHFEGRRYDKVLMAGTGAKCVSMSVKPECAVASLYAKNGIRVIPMGFVTNTAQEEMNDDHHREVAVEAAPKLGRLLEHAVEVMHY